MNPNIPAAHRSRRHAAITRAAIALAALGTIACGGGGDSGTAPTNDGSGSYVLRQVDDASLPATIHQGPWLDRVNTRFYNKLIMKVVSGTIELDGEDGYSMTFNLEYNADGTPGTTSVSREGDYTVQGADITFRYGSNPPGTFLGRVQGGVITIPLDFMGKGVSNAYAFKR